LQQQATQEQKPMSVRPHSDIFFGIGKQAPRAACSIWRRRARVVGAQTCLGAVEHFLFVTLRDDDDRTMDDYYSLPQYE